MRMPGWRWHALRKKSQKIFRIFNLQNCILLVSQNVNDMKDLVSSKRSSNAWGSYQDQDPNTTMLSPESGTRMSNASPSCRIIVGQRQQNSLKTYQTNVVLSVVLSFFFSVQLGREYLLTVVGCRWCRCDGGWGMEGDGDTHWPLPASTFSSLLMTFCRRCCCSCRRRRRCCCCCSWWCHCYWRCCCCWNRNFLVVVTRPIVLVAAVAAVVDGVQMKTFPIIAVSQEARSLRQQAGVKRAKKKKKKKGNPGWKKNHGADKQVNEHQIELVRRIMSVQFTSNWFGFVSFFWVSPVPRLPPIGMPPWSLI